MGFRNCICCGMTSPVIPCDSFTFCAHKKKQLCCALLCLYVLYIILSKAKYFYSACSVAASYKPPMLVTRFRLPACAHDSSGLNGLFIASIQKHNVYLQFVRVPRDFHPPHISISSLQMIVQHPSTHSSTFCFCLRTHHTDLKRVINPLG